MSGKVDPTSLEPLDFLPSNRVDRRPADVRDTPEIDHGLYRRGRKTACKQPPPRMLCELQGGATGSALPHFCLVHSFVPLGFLL